ncbi:hypothetical protein IHE45_09G057900 [Dioscorea alata]|uniref:Uncharacterized protein n=1 Tax=Dioscorea alata TaxID=55571 RepID=A0ACB7VFL0_DIOAL|nr:hypothetical protein IHE45_09G057900 [Dioscorea alata]
MPSSSSNTNSIPGPTTSNVTASMTTGILPSPSVGHMINMKLGRENYLLWKAQFLPYLRVHQLLDYVDGSAIMPNKTVIQTTASGAFVVPNPDYVTWLHKDQMTLRGRLVRGNVKTLPGIWW